MANFIIKKDGKKEPFDAQKIKSAVVAAATQAGVTAEEGVEIAEKVASTITQSVANLSEVVGAEVRARALSQLDAIAPTIAEAWRNHDEKKQ